MTTAEKVIKTKVGLLELGKQLGNVIEGLSSDGLQPRQFLSVQGTLRDEAERQRCKRSRGASRT